MSGPEIYARVTPAGRWSWWVEVIEPADGSWVETSWGRTVLGSRARADRHATRWVLRARARRDRLRDETHEVRP